MKEIIENIYKKINLQEDIEIINNIMKQVYLHEGISTKLLAKENSIPIPIATLIKKELIKVGFLKQQGGVCLDKKGKEYVETFLGYANLNIELYKQLLNNDLSSIQKLYTELESIYNNRPQVDVTIDQAKCTLDTAIKRALQCLINNSFINKTITCLGDDDLISIALSFLTRKLYKDTNGTIKIIVLEKDKRIITYINDIKIKYNLNIECVELDLRDSLPNNLLGSSDCIFIDPPYTLKGLELFVSRAISLLKNKQDLNIFLSYAHKNVNFILKMQKLFNRMGIIISEIIPHFNSYEGAGILGGTSQLIILKTTESTTEIIEYSHIYKDNIYTYDYNQTIKEYKCRSCQRIVKVGKGEKIKTIENLKGKGCICGKNTFNLIKRKLNVPQVHNNNGQHLILDCYNCDKNKINDIEYIRVLMLEIAKIIKATVVTSEFHQFNPYGISGVIIIKESHITIHTWPEYNYAAIDIFTCGNILKLNNAQDYLQKKLGEANIIVDKIEREIIKI